jgi:hypothetical protein
VPSIPREDASRRVKAARAYAGFRTPRALAEHPELERYGITASRIIETEAQNRDAQLWELEAIARATGLSASFLTGEHLDSDSLAERLTRIEAKLDRLLGEAA